MNIENELIYKDFIENIEIENFYRDLPESIEKNEDKRITEEDIEYANRISKKIEKEIKKPYFLKHGKLCIRNINPSTYIFSERNFNNFYEIQIISYQKEKELSTFLSFIKNLEEIYGKPKKIVFKAGKWIYNHLPKSVKQFFKIGYIKENKIPLFIITIKKLYLQGHSLPDIRKIAMITCGIVKISIKTIAKIIHILKHETITPISHAINYLKWLYITIRRHGRGIFWYSHNY
jgi:hypothetical protein